MTAQGVHGLWFMVRRRGKTINYELLTTNKPFDSAQDKRQGRSGFSLIELMIVISLFAIITIVATISYISFEGGQRLKNGALQIKSDLRQAQINAQSGDKGAGSCAAINSLAGWYIKFNSGPTINSYTIAGDCLDTSNNETSFVPTIYTLPQGVTISAISYGAIAAPSPTPIAVGSDASIFFRPLNYIVSFHGSAATAPSPTPYIGNIDFFNAAGALDHTLSGAEFVITLDLSGETYKVKINSSGQVSESKT